VRGAVEGLASRFRWCSDEFIVSSGSDLRKFKFWVEMADLPKSWTEETQLVNIWLGVLARGLSDIGFEHLLHHC